MKTPFLLLSLLLASTMFVNAQQKTENIKVYGNCSMCKKRIETAAKNAGATTASWNEDSKLLSVKFDNAKTSSKKIQDKIASVGHDTQEVQAPTDVYEKLEECCLYDRKPISKKQ